MSRDFQINGETLVSVKSRSDSLISTLTQFGLAIDAIRVSLVPKHKDINVDAWGGADGPPADIQAMLAEVSVSMNVIHIDRPILDECIRLAMGFPPAIGQLPRAGTRMGANAPRFTPPNCYVGLNLTSPVGNKPWRFFYAYLAAEQAIPLGTEKSVYALKWRCIPFVQDPWNGGLGALGSVLWDHGADT